jgi:hypothetical protein
VLSVVASTTLPQQVIQLSTSPFRFNQVISRKRQNMFIDLNTVLLVSRSIKPGFPLNKVPEVSKKESGQCDRNGKVTKACDQLYHREGRHSLSRCELDFPDKQQIAYVLGDLEAQEQEVEGAPQRPLGALRFLEGLETQGEHLCVDQVCLKGKANDPELCEGIGKEMDRLD